MQHKKNQYPKFNDATIFRWRNTEVLKRSRKKIKELWRKRNVKTIKILFCRKRIDDTNGYLYHHSATH